MDLELLAEFGERRSEAAFAELVQRYVDLVHSAALRLVVDSHLAEDVSQTVFVALAKQANEVTRKLARGAPLSGWLHLTTRNVAAKAVRTETRRRAREQEAAAMRELSTQSAEIGWDQIAPHVDHALAELNAADRDALLLRFFERKTARQIGARLGLSEEAAQKRVVRALDRLRQVFAARGIAISSTTLGSIMGAHVIEAAPSALAVGISQFALTAGSATIAPGAAAWFHHFASQIAMTKVQTSILVVATSAALLPIGLEQMELNKLRAELAAAGAARKLPAPVQSESIPSGLATSTSEEDEIARLRREAERLRLQIATQGGERKASGRARPGPTLLKIGQSVPLSELVFAGNDTPAAALQSIVSFQRDGDLEAFLEIALLPPDKAAEIHQLMASAERREELRNRLADEVRGTAEVEILAEKRLNERRMQVVYKATKQNEVSTNSAGFGLTSRGWLHLP